MTWIFQPLLPAASEIEPAINVNGSLSATLATATILSVGMAEISATALVTLSSITITSLSDIPITGASSVVLSGLGKSLVGGVDVLCVLTKTLSNTTFSSAGIADAGGNLSATVGLVEFNATAAIFSVVNGGFGAHLAEDVIFPTGQPVLVRDGAVKNISKRFIHVELNPVSANEALN